MKFPKTIYLAQEKSGEEVYWVAHEYLAEIEEGCAIGVYTFTEEAKLTVTRTLQQRRTQ